MFKKLFFIFFLYSSLLFTQKKTYPSEAYFKMVSDKIAPKDPALAIKIADSLINSAETPEIKGRSYMLAANIFFFQNKSEETIQYAEKAKEIFNITKNYELQARICGLLAEQYRYIELREKSKNYLLEGLKTANKIAEKAKKYKVKARFYSELTEQEINDGQLDTAIKYQLTGLSLLSKITEDSINIGHGYQTLGTLHLLKKDYKLAENYFLKAINILPESTNDKAIAYDGYGKVLVIQKHYDEAEMLFLKVFQFAESAKHLDIQKLASKSLADLYEETKQFEKSSFYRKKYVESLRSDYRHNAQVVDKKYNKIEKEKQEYVNWNSIKNILMVFGFLVLVGFIIIFVINRKRSKEKYKKFKNIIDHYKEKAEYVLETAVDTSDEDIKDEKEIITKESKIENKQADIAINKVTEKKILSLLGKFENDEIYNNSDISLSYLAREFNTNPTYISYIVKKYKNDDFKSYINKLRINYIIHKLNTSDIHRKYKVAALAEECGFSTHSKFTTIFKSITGMSPSSFISFIEQEKAKEK